MICYFTVLQQSVNEICLVKKIGFDGQLGYTRNSEG